MELKKIKKDNYRPLSFSEGYVDKLLCDNIEISIQPVYNSPKVKQRDYKKYIFKRLIMFLSHLFLIAMFEIIFFFKIVSNFEKDGVLNLITSAINPIINEIQKLNTTDKEYIISALNDIVNITQLDDLNNISIKTINKNNYGLYQIAWIYALVIGFISFVLIFINLFKKKVNLVKVVFDNLFIIVLLGLYEFIFFKTIILNYQFIDKTQLVYYVYNKII